MYKYLIGLMLLALSVSAEATGYKVRFDSAEDTISSKVKVNGSALTGLFGSYNIQDNTSNDLILAFCVDPYQKAYGSFTSYTKSDLDASDFVNYGTTRLQNVQKLFDNAYADLMGDDTKTAGFHLALWEIFNDNKNTTSGNVKAYYTNAGMLSYANSLLTQLAGWEVKDLYNFTFYKSAYKQDYISFTPVSPVPVPAALPLLASGLVGIGFMRRRKTV